VVSVRAHDLPMFQPIQLPFKIRQSSLETARCLFRFHKLHLLGFKDPESEFSTRGTKVHALARQYVEYLVATRQETDWTYAQDLAHQSDIGDEAADIFIGWAMRRVIDPARVFACEYQVRLGWNLLPCADDDAVFSADIDRLDIFANEAEIVDYKSHFQIFEPTTIQAVLYAWLIWKILPNLETVRFTLDFLRYGSSRTREFTRDQMEQLDTYVKNQVQRLIEAYKDDLWPATINSGCSWCHLSCPLVEQGMSREQVGQIQSPAQASQMAQQMFAIGRVYKQLHDSLRSYANIHGAIDAGNDISLGFSRQEQFEYSVKTIETLNAEHGFAHDRALRVNPTEVKKIGKSYSEYVSRARKTAKDRSKTVFKFSNAHGDPLEIEDEEGLD
jgi:PD-(D/E)XK nuclease superfamily